MRCQHATAITQTGARKARLNQRFFRLAAELRQTPNVLPSVMEVDRRDTRIALTKKTNSAEELAGRQHAHCGRDGPRLRAGGGNANRAAAAQGGGTYHAKDAGVLTARSGRTDDAGAVARGCRLSESRTRLQACDAAARKRALGLAFARRAESRRRKRW